MTPQVPRLALTINAPVATVEAFKALAKAEGLSHHALLQKMVDDHTRRVNMDALQEAISLVNLCYEALPDGEAKDDLGKAYDLLTSHQ